MDALSIGGEEGRGLLRGWCVVCWGACTECAESSLSEVEYEEVGDGGRAENEIEPAAVAPAVDHK